MIYFTNIIMSIDDDITTLSGSVEDSEIESNDEGEQKNEVPIHELIQEELKPRFEKDNAGFYRKIYSLNGKTFAFKGREELPTYDTMDNSKTTFLGEAPNWIGNQKFRKYERYIENTQNQTEATEHFVVNKTVIGVLDLAIKMGNTDERLPKMREEIARGEYSESSLALIDALLATNFMDYTGYSGKQNNDGEAIVLLSLLGNSQAQAYVEDTVKIMQDLNKEKIIEKQNIEYKDALRVEDLCAVHATRYSPKSERNGYSVRSTFDSTGGKLFRNTIHTSLNHKVSDHMLGQWGDAGYVLISPFQSMMKANGLPTLLNTVDTYWTVNPGETVQFEDATLVKPAGSEIDTLFEEVGENLVLYKSEGYDIEDLKKLVSYSKSDGSLEKFSKSISSKVSDKWFDGEIRENWDFELLFDTLYKYISLNYNKENNQPSFLDVLISGKENVIEDEVRKLVVDANLRSTVKEGIENVDKLVESLTGKFTSSVNFAIHQQVNELAVNHAIRKRGFTVQSGGMWAWGGSMEVTSRTALLGRQLGVNTGAHSRSNEALLEDVYFSALDKAALDKNKEFSNIDWKRFHPVIINFLYNLDSINQKTRRAYYASGHLTTRYGKNE
ncbi:hypothetical protein GX830_01100 [Candidatus Dojkabacteria bacterium]|nr:hypothetical protein [Candidatus Dojkabacteria bacterium]